MLLYHFYCYCCFAGQGLCCDHVEMIVMQHLLPQIGQIGATGSAQESKYQGRHLVSVVEISQNLSHRQAHTFMIFCSAQLNIVPTVPPNRQNIINASQSNSSNKQTKRTEEVPRQGSYSQTNQTHIKEYLNDAEDDECLFIVINIQVRDVILLYRSVCTQCLAIG